MTAVATHPLGLRTLIVEEIERNGPNCDLNHLDISQVTSLAGVFSDLPFTGDISKWDVSHIVSLTYTFRGSPFNGDISRWDTGRVQDMANAFERGQFNGNLSRWNTSSASTMESMFEGSRFDGDLSGWDTSSVKNMSRMFAASMFNGNISTWLLPTVVSMEGLFEKSLFSGDLSGWSLPIWATVHSIVPATFSGVFPRMGSLSDPYANYVKMIGSASALDSYLQRMPLNAVHADLVMNEKMDRCPQWMRPEDYQWMQEQKALLLAVSNTPEDAYGLLVTATKERACPSMAVSSADFGAMGL